MNMGIKFITPTRTEEIGVMRLPYRKSICLYAVRGRGTMVEPLAYFRSDEDAERFDDILNWLAALLEVR